MNYILIVLLTLFSNLAFSQISRYSKYTPIDTVDPRGVEIFVDALGKRAQYLNNLHNQTQQEVTQIIYEGFDVINQRLRDGVDKSIIDYYEKEYNNICSNINSTSNQSIFDGKLKLKKLVSSLYSYEVRPVSNSTIPRTFKGKSSGITKNNCVLWDLCDFAKAKLITEVKINQDVEIISKCDDFYFVKLANGLKGYVFINNIL